MAVIDDYLYDRSEDVHRSGGYVLRHETGAAGGRYVRFEAAVAFGREYDAVLHVFELIEEVEGRAHRHLYAYHCLYRDRFLFRYDRDPDNHPEMPEHKHLRPTSGGSRGTR
jgi:hypothetical protein